jgi:hypothetical protein
MLGQKQRRKKESEGKRIFCYFSKEINQMNSNIDLNSTKQK